MKKILIVLFLGLMYTGYSQVTDIDGNTYKTVEIVAQELMAENLKVEHFKNGESIPNCKTDKEWELAGANRHPCWCYYENNSNNTIKYGKLYNWYAVNDPRGLAPEGWHIVTDDEWTILIDSLIWAKKMKSLWWKENGKGTNESGFNGRPGGFREYKGNFSKGGVGYYGYWWSSTQFSTDNSWILHLNFYGSNITRNNFKKSNGFSVRCIKD